MGQSRTCGVYGFLHVKFKVLWSSDKNGDGWNS